MNSVVKLFGIPVAKVTETEAVERIIAFAKDHNPQHATGKMPVVPVPQLPTTNSQLPTINYQLSTINYQLSTIN